MKIKRLRWYKIQFGTPFNKIAEAIGAYSYSDDNPIGFELIETSKYRLSARYIERQYISEQILHPFGDSENITSIKYSIFSFDIIYINKGLGVIKVLNPPQSLKQFVNILASICDGNFSITKVNHEIEKIYDAIVTDKTIDRYTIHRLKVSAAPFSRNTNEKLELNSTDNAYDELKKKYKHGQYKLDSIHLKARING